MFALLIAVAAAASSAQPLLLRCNGFDSELGGMMEHNIIISGNKANLDGQTYTISSKDAFFLVLKNAETTMSINRTTGAYMMYRGSATIGMLTFDASRPEDAGCVKVEQKF